MNQIKLTLSDPLLEFLGRHRTYGFRDRSELVRTALARYQKDLEQRELEESAQLYSELYEPDSESHHWVEDSSRDWPS
ncbi:hypothetical protein IV102_24605 [bacterium]|nr:hypothetical protein [bacterium]